MKRKKEKYVDTPIDKFCKILIYVILPLFVATIIFIIKFTSHASEIDTTTYFPMGQNDNNKFNQTTLNYIDTHFDTENNFVFVSYLGKSQSGASDLYCAYFWAKNSDESNKLYGEIKNNGYQFSLYPNPVAQRQAFYYYNGACTDYYDSQLNWNLVTQNIDSSLYNTNKSYVTNFRIYRTNDVNSGVVLKYGSEEVPIMTGHATPPDTFESPVYTTGHSAPQNVPPTITVNNYTWTTYTPPTIDDSGIIETIKSEIQVINYLAGWLKDNLQGMLTNLVNNIKSLFEYLVQTIQYYGNLLISNIQNLITTFYNNMVSIGEDIISKLTYIVSPLDTTALQTAIQNTGIYNDYDRIFDIVGDAFGFYNDISEPNSFTIPIDLRNVTILHQTQIVYIDLGWLNSCKTIIRAFMWCVLTFGLLYTIIDSIPDYLQGNDE